MVKTPEEIKKGLECCCTDKGCAECPYNERVEECFQNQLETDALAYIQHLEKQLAFANQSCDEIALSNVKYINMVERLDAQLKQAERERDAALSEWKRTKMDSEGMCWTCKHGLITDIGSCRCISPDPCDEGENWEWRSVCEENSK